MRRIDRVLVAALMFGAVACSEEPKIEDQPDEPILGEVDPNAPGEDVQSLDALSGPAYQGVWATEQSLCDVFPASADPSPMVITDEAFVEYGRRCIIGKAEEGTEGGWQLELICSNDGIEFTEVLDVDVDGAMLRLRRGEQEEELYMRCSGA